MPHLFNFASVFSATSNRGAAFAMSPETLERFPSEQLAGAISDMTGKTLKEGDEITMQNRDNLPFGLVVMLSKGNNVLAARFLSPAALTPPVDSGRASQI